MTNELAPRTASSSLAVNGAQDFWTDAQLAGLRQLGVEGASRGDLVVFLNYAQRTGLDPFARQIYMMGRRQKDQRTGDWITKWTIQSSIDGLRIVAERSGDYAGQTDVEYCGEDGIWRGAWTAKTAPVAARIGVLRHGFLQPLYAVAYYDEYVQTTQAGSPTQVWREKPRLMLAKCAEALALRKAFPNDLSGIYTADEMGTEMPATRTALQAAVANVQPGEASGDLNFDPWESATPAAKTREELPLHDAETGEVLDGEVVEDAAPAPEPATKAQLAAMATMLSKCGMRTLADRHKVILKIVGRDVASSAELTKAEASTVIDTIKPLADSSNPINALADWYTK